MTPRTGSTSGIRAFQVLGCACALAALPSGTSMAADVITIGSQRYVRTQVQTHPAEALIAQRHCKPCGEGAVLGWLESDLETLTTTVRFYLIDKQGVPRTTPLGPQPDPDRVLDWRACCIDDRVWLFWRAWWDDAIYGQAFDDEGAPLMPPIDITGQQEFGDAWDVVCGRGRIAVVFESYSTPENISMRVLASDGAFLSDVVPFASAGFPPRLTWLLGGAVRPNGALLCLSLRFPSSTTRRTMIGPTDINYAIGPAHPIGAENATGWGVWTLSDGSHGVATAYGTPDILEIHRVDDLGQPVAPIVTALIDDLGIPHLLPDGSAVVWQRFGAGRVPATWVDPSGAVIASVADITRPEVMPLRSGAVTKVSDDGTVWALFQDVQQFLPYGAWYLTILRPIPTVSGDMDADGALTNFDIDPFVMALVDREAYLAANPHTTSAVVDLLGDMNGDGLLNNFDIDPFVDALVNGP